MTIDTRDVNEFGPGKFRTSAENNLEQNCYFNRNNTDSRFKCYLARRDNSNPEKLFFFIREQNCCFDQNFLNKNSGFLLTKSQMNATSNGKGKSTDKENSNGGSETDEGRRNRSMDAAESAFSRGGQLLFERRRGQKKK